MEKFFSEQLKKGEQGGGKKQGEQGDQVVATGDAPKKLPKGVVLGKDGKP